MITCVTCSGDRPYMLDRARFYVERCCKGLDYEWIVVDDGVTPYDPGGCSYIRRTSDGPNSLVKNFRLALQQCNRKYIFVFEDDDWYHPDKVKFQLAQLHHHILHGFTDAMYYNIRHKKWHVHSNYGHASLCETAFQLSFVPQIFKLLDEPDIVKVVDFQIWAKYRTQAKLSPPIPHRFCVGIKGAPGRKGLGSGHNPHPKYKDDPDWKVLTKVIGSQDTEWYKECIQKFFATSVTP